jgi:hypothetical protein
MHHHVDNRSADAPHIVAPIKDWVNTVANSTTSLITERKLV